jgi:hypothetical protein
MSLFSYLRNTAASLGLLRIATVSDPEEPTKITTRSISLHALTTELRTAEVEALATGAGDFDVPFDQIFAAAGVKTVASSSATFAGAGQGAWSIDRLHAMLETTPYKDLPRAETQPAVLATLGAEKVAVEDLVKDAIARDKAIDAYAARIFEKRQESRRARSRKKIELQGQIAALQAQVADLDDQSQTADRQWNDWWQRKLAYERRMAQALGYLLQDPIVTIDAQLPVDHNSE